VGVREELGPAERLAGLLLAAVEVTDHRLDRAYRLAVELELEAQHAVRGGVLRAHVELHQLAVERIVLVARSARRGRIDLRPVHARPAHVLERLRAHRAASGCHCSRRLRSHSRYSRSGSMPWCGKSLRSGWC